MLMLLVIIFSCVNLLMIGGDDNFERIILIIIIIIDETHGERATFSVSRLFVCSSLNTSRVSDSSLQFVFECERTSEFQRMSEPPDDRPTD